MEPEPTDAPRDRTGDAIMFKNFTFKRTKGSGAILNTGDEMQIRFAAEIIPGHIVEAIQYKTAYIVKYRPVGRTFTCVASVFPGITNLPGISGHPRDFDIFENTAYMYYPDPQDKKRLHIWPCPVSSTKGWFGADTGVIQVAKLRIDHIIELQNYQNSLLEVVPGGASASTSAEEAMNEREEFLHKSWWR